MTGQFIQCYPVCFEVNCKHKQNTKIPKNIQAIAKKKLNILTENSR